MEKNKRKAVAKNKEEGHSFYGGNVHSHAKVGAKQ